MSYIWDFCSSVVFLALLSRCAMINLPFQFGCSSAVAWPHTEQQTHTGLLRPAPGVSDLSRWMWKFAFLQIPSWYQCCSTGRQTRVWESLLSKHARGLHKVHGKCVLWTNDAWVSKFFVPKTTLNFNSISMYFLKYPQMENYHPCRSGGCGDCIWCNMLWSQGMEEIPIQW